VNLGRACAITVLLNLNWRQRGREIVDTDNESRVESFVLETVDLNRAIESQPGLALPRKVLWRVPSGSADLELAADAAASVEAPQPAPHLTRREGDALDPGEPGARDPHL
jgi:hypothetical protein